LCIHIKRTSLRNFFLTETARLRPFTFILASQLRYCWLSSAAYQTPMVANQVRNWASSHFLTTFKSSRSAKSSERKSFPTNAISPQFFSPPVILIKETRVGNSFEAFQELKCVIVLILPWFVSSLLCAGLTYQAFGRLANFAFGFDVLFRNSITVKWRLFCGLGEVDQHKGATLEETIKRTNKNRGKGVRKQSIDLPSQLGKYLLDGEKRLYGFKPKYRSLLYSSQ
jgi:hypothetical protein